MGRAEIAAGQAHQWWDVIARIAGASRSVSGVDLVKAVNDAVAVVGMTADIYLADRAQRVLTPIGSGYQAAVNIDGTLPGRAFQLTQVVVSSQNSHAGEVLWVPLIDGTERLGLLRLSLPDGVDGHDNELQQRCSVLGTLLGYTVAAKFTYSDSFHRTTRTTPLTPAAELLWQLLPPLTVTGQDLVVSAVLQPHDRVGGDAFDYALDQGRAFVAIYDAVGHDMQSGLTTSVALAAVRNARRSGERDLTALARRADELIAGNVAAKQRFVTAVLAWLNPETGVLSYLVAGNPPPMLLRVNKTVKTLSNGPRVPLGVLGGPDVIPDEEQLEPGDRLLLYTDGITEARDQDGQFFGIERLIEFAERSSAAGLSAPETLRRLSHAHLDRQGGHIQDDATLLMLDWRPPTRTSLPLTPEQQVRE